MLKLSKHKILGHNCGGWRHNTQECLQAKAMFALCTSVALTSSVIPGVYQPQSKYWWVSISLKRRRRGEEGRGTSWERKRKKDYRNLYPNQIIKNEAQSAKWRNMEIVFHLKETAWSDVVYAQREHSLVVFVQNKVRDKDKSEVKINGSTGQVGN